MALTLPWLTAAVVWAMGAGPGAPPPPLVETIVASAVNGTADALAARRGVRGGRPLVVRLVDRPHMRAAVDALLPVARSVEEARDEAALYQRLGLMEPPSPDHEHVTSPSADVSGLYDVADKWLLIGDWIDLGATRFALSRDIAQALLDRRFDLARWLPAPATRHAGDGDSDALLARQAVVEGDATTQALEHLDPEGMLPPPRLLADIAEKARTTIVAEQAGASTLDLRRRLFVEIDGLTFVARIRGRAPWTAVDGAWRRPPQSTEQILHPEKYQRQELPDDVGARLPTQLRGGWRASYRDTLGELGARLFLARAVDDYRAERAAAGWGGDRALWLRRPSPRGEAEDGEPGASTFAAWITTWDDETDAQDFAAQAASAMVALARSPAGDTRAPGSMDQVRVVDGEGRLYLLEQRRRTVGMLFAAPSDAEPVLSQLMSAEANRRTARPARRHAGRVRSR